MVAESSNMFIAASWFEQDVYMMDAGRTRSRVGLHLFMQQGTEYKERLARLLKLTEDISSEV